MSENTEKPKKGRRGGRQKGTPNKSSLIARERIADLGCDPLMILVNIAQDEGVDPAVRVNAAKKLVDKCYPDLKAIDHTANSGEALPTLIVKWADDEDDESSNSDSV